MQLFQRHGYAGVSVGRLTAAMGISPPSLYAAFGDKDQLFKEAMDLYVAQDWPASIVDQEGGLNTILRSVFDAAIQSFTSPTSGGCPLASDLVLHGKDQQAVASYMTSLRMNVLDDLDYELAADTSDQLLSGATPRQAAIFATALLFGLATLAADGVRSSELRFAAFIGQRALSGPR